MTTVAPVGWIIRFWNRADTNGPIHPYQLHLWRCWLWTGRTNKQGYGIVTINHRRFYAHRIAYELTHDEPLGTLFVLHSCDNPPCINPLHLFEGTHADNMDDMMRKGRGRKTDNDIRRVRADCPDDCPCRTKKYVKRRYYREAYACIMHVHRPLANPHG